MKHSSNGFEMRDYKRELFRMANKYKLLKPEFDLDIYLQYWGLKK